MVDQSDRITHLENESAELRKHLKLLMQINSAAQESRDGDAFLNRCLEEVAAIEHWEVGQVWFLSDEAEQVIVCHKECVYATRDIDAFREDSLSRRFTVGIGLPGRVCGTSSASFIIDIQQAAGFTFPRIASASAVGLNSALAFPLNSGTKCDGAMEFFAAEMTKPSSETLRFYEKLGMLIGTYYQQKETERKHLRNEVRHGLILDHAHNAFIAMDTSGRIVDWNVKSEKYFGWTRAAVLGKTLSDVIIPEEHRAAHAAGMQRYLATGQGRIFDLPIRTRAVHKSGAFVNIELTIFVVPTGDEQTFGAFIVNLDEQRKAPLELG